MSHVRITEETRDKLNVLKGVLGLKSIDAVIDSLMESRMYNQAFFDKLKGITHGQPFKKRGWSDWASIVVIASILRTDVIEMGLLFLSVIIDMKLLTQRIIVRKEKKRRGNG